MKKFAIGCAVVVVVLVAGASIVTYYLYNKAKSFLQQSEAIAALEKNVVNTTPFTPPANGELTEDMVKRFAAVEDAIQARLAPRFREIAAMQDEFMRRQQAEQRQSSVTEDVKNVTVMMGFVLQAMGAGVDALNQQRFSMDEYQWVRGQVWAASGMNIVELSSRNFADAVKQGGGVTRQVGATGDVPQRNRELVAPYLAKLKDWAPLAFFGF